MDAERYEQSQHPAVAEVLQQPLSIDWIGCRGRLSRNIGRLMHHASHASCARRRELGDPREGADDVHDVDRAGPDKDASTSNFEKAIRHPCPV